jgi:1,4-dihydroxy-2-naphthoate polyprenyltransferase
VVSNSGTSDSLILGLLVRWYLFCVTIQLGTNLHNDYSDFVQGSDDVQTRVGHVRATAAGWLSPSQTCCAATGVLLMTLMAGSSLISLAQQEQSVTTSGEYYYFFPWLLILTSLYNAFAYTGGPYPLGYLHLLPYHGFSLAYAGLGDLFVFLYFGLVATLMIPYLLVMQPCLFANTESEPSSETFQSFLQAQKQSLMVWCKLLLTTDIGRYACQVGFLGVNIIVVNNLRDRHTDALSNKRTTAVRFGAAFARWEYLSCLVAAYLLVLLDAFRSSSLEETELKGNSENRRITWIRLLPALSFPLAFREAKSVFRKEGAALNQHVGGAAKVQFLFCILLSVAVILSPQPSFVRSLCRA